MKKETLTKVLISAACLVLCLAFFVSCGPKVTGVKSLVAANINAQSKVDNYHMDGEVDMKITLDSSGLQSLLGPANPKLPVEMTLAADSGTETAHVITEAGTKLFGNSVTLQTVEMYMDMKNKVVYAKAGEDAEWKKSEAQEEQMDIRKLAGGLAIVGKSVLENATFGETEELYSLTMPAEKAGELVADLHLLDRVDLGIADVRDITVEGGEIRYNVDKETLLVSSIELDDVDIRGTGTYEDVAVDLKFPVNGSFRFTRYDELVETEYAIPAEVTGAAQ